jgi:glycosyltransferase involved in cell wall biosynthesis
MGKIGGNLRTLVYILEFLDPARFRPIVVAPIETEFTKRLAAQGTECMILEPPKSIGRYGGKALRDGLMGQIVNLVGLLRYNFQIRRLIRENAVDVVYCNSIRAVLCAAVGAKLARVPVLWYIKGELANPVLDRIGFALSDKVLFFCEANRDDQYPALIKRYARKIDVLRIGIDWRSIAAAEARDKSALVEELDLASGRTNLIVLGQLYRPKGVHFLLEALAKIVPEYPDLRLYIVGDEVLPEFKPYRAELDAIIARHGLEPYVAFTGWRTDAMDLLCRMDIVIHPSLAEGFGRAVLESMALGRAVIASRVGGLREIIKDGVNGFLVDPGDVNAIADRLRRLLADPAARRRMGDAARAEVRSGYLIEDKIHRLGEMWAGMAARN